MNKHIPAISYLFIFLGIFSLAAFFRLYGVNWDQNQHLHPDERFLTMVAGAISWPQDIFEYLNTETSPLNPHNRGFGFFVYGTFPLFFTKWMAQLTQKTDYNQLTILGRQLSAIFDLGTVALVFLIAKSIVSSSKYYVLGMNKKILNTKYVIRNTFPLISMFLYSIMVLPIQLSHFFTVDTYLTFFLTLSFFLLIKINTPARGWSVFGGKYYILYTLLGISFGLALASKISALLFLPIIILGLIIFFLRNRNLFLFFVFCSLFFVSSYLTFRLTNPYLFENPNIFDITLNKKVLDNWKQLKSFDDPKAWFPPAVQWITTKPYLFPLKNIILWGLGLPLGIISLISIAYTIGLLVCWVIVLFKKKQLTINNQQLTIFLSLFWILLFFFYQGFQFVKALRYFYPIYPFLAILSGYFLHQCLDSIIHKLQWRYEICLFAYLLICLFTIVYPFSFLSIYSRPHTRIAASYWIYENIPTGTTLSGEHWDDYLPVSLPETGLIHEKYKTVELPLYGQDTKEKWKEISTKLSEIDYILLTSNRLYGSIMTVPDRYPVTYEYYQALFDGRLGFERIAEFTSRPNIYLPFINLCLTPPFAYYGKVAQKNQPCLLPGISFVDDYADETFTVYDHPKVIVFKKVKKVDYSGLLK